MWTCCFHRSSGLANTTHVVNPIVIHPTFYLKWIGAYTIGFSTFILGDFHFGLNGKYKWFQLSHKWLGKEVSHLRLFSSCLWAGGMSKTLLHGVPNDSSNHRWRHFSWLTLWSFHIATEHHHFGSINDGTKWAVFHMSSICWVSREAKVSTKIQPQSR